MASKRDIVLYSDGGDMTVGRTIPAYVLGAFDVAVPEGREQEKADARIRNGYICRPPDPASGSLDVGFIKADVKLDLGAKTSSMERVVDSALRRTEGAVFFERDISAAGLGAFVPGRDFSLYDVVSVDVWGKLLESPVTAIDFEGSVSRRLSPRVHVGGQMITDAEALQARTDATLERVEAENRQRLKELGGLSSRVDSVSRVAGQARVSADAAGTAAAVADGKAQLADGKAEAADTKAEVADNKAEDALAKWRQQKDELDTLQSQQINDNRTFSEGIKDLAERVDVRSTGMVFLRSDQRRYSKTHGIGVRMPGFGRWLMIVAVPEFRGSCVIDVYYANGSVVPYHVKSSDFETVYSWRHWEYRDSYDGSFFDPLLHEGSNEMRVFWLKVDIGNVVAARVLSDKVVWT